MTTPTGTISMTDIQTEFGGSSPIALDEYYAGGSYVPAGLSGVPSSGTISMNNLRGKTKTTPLTSVVTPGTTAEGNNFTVTVSASTTVYPTIYWKLTDYSNLQDADFDAVSGSVSYNSTSESYPSFTFGPVTDAAIEGSGTFNVTFYSDSLRTVSVGQSSTLTVTDTYTAALTLGSTTIYRYANKDTSYRTSVATLTTAGLVGSTVYYEVYGDAALTSADIELPASLTGTLTVPANGIVTVTVRSKDWNGTKDITADKNVYVRYRLTNSSGSILGTSTAITLLAMPDVTISFSPTTIREGQSSTITCSTTNIPYGSAASFFWRQSTILGNAVAADWLITDGTTATLTGELILTADVVDFIVYAALDTIAEGQESIFLFWYINDPNTGTPIRLLDSILIQSPAQIISATGSYASVQITGISSYPVDRTFTVITQADYSQQAPYTVTVGAGQTSSAAIEPFEYLATEGTVGIYDMQYIISNSAYETYTIVKNGEAFVFPVYGATFSIEGTNATGQARTVVVRITRIASVGYLRDFTVYYKFKEAGGAAWGPWTALATTINVLADSKSSFATTVFNTTSANAQYDIQFKLERSGHETKTSQEFNNIWL
jgi:hypothetical protein